MRSRGTWYFFLANYWECGTNSPTKGYSRTICFRLWNPKFGWLYRIQAIVLRAIPRIDGCVHAHHSLMTALH